MQNPPELEGRDDDNQEQEQEPVAEGEEQEGEAKAGEDLEALGRAAGLSMSDLNLLHDLCELEFRTYSPSDVTGLRLIMNQEDYKEFESLSNQLADLDREFQTIAEIFRDEYRPEQRLNHLERTNQRQAQDHLISLRRNIEAIDGRREFLVSRSEERIREIMREVGSVSTDTSFSGTRRSRDDAGLDEPQAIETRNVRRRRYLSPIGDIGDISLSTRDSNRGVAGRSPGPAFRRDILADTNLVRQISKFGGRYSESFPDHILNVTNIIESSTIAQADPEKVLRLSLRDNALRFYQRTYGQEMRKERSRRFGGGDPYDFMLLALRNKYMSEGLLGEEMNKLEEMRQMEGEDVRTYADRWKEQSIRTGKSFTIAEQSRLFKRGLTNDLEEKAEYMGVLDVDTLAMRLSNLNLAAKRRRRYRETKRERKNPHTFEELLAMCQDRTIPPAIFGRMLNEANLTSDQRQILLSLRNQKAYGTQLTQGFDGNFRGTFDARREGDAEDKTTEKKKITICLACGKVGHPTHRCKIKEAKAFCLRCRRFGHWHQACKAKRNYKFPGSGMPVAQEYHVSQRPSHNSRHAQVSSQKFPKKTRRDLNYLGVKIDGRKVNALLDGGSTHSCLSREFCVRRNISYQGEEKPNMSILTAAGKIPVLARKTCIVDLEGDTFQQPFLIMETNLYDALLGLDFLRAYRLAIFHYEEQDYILTDGRFIAISNTVPKEGTKIVHVNTHEAEEMIQEEITRWTKRLMKECETDYQEPHRRELPVTPRVLSVESEEPIDVSFAEEADLRTTENFPREDESDASSGVEGTPSILQFLQKIATRWNLDIEIGHFQNQSYIRNEVEPTENQQALLVSQRKTELGDKSAFRSEDDEKGILLNPQMNGEERTKNIYRNLKAMILSSERVEGMPQSPFEVKEDDEDFSIFEKAPSTMMGEDEDVIEVLRKEMDKNDHLSDEQKAQTLNLFLEYRDVFSSGLKELGATNAITFDAELKPEAKGKECFIRHRSQGAVMDFIVDKIMNRYHETGLYQKATSDFGSPAFLVLKRRDQSKKFDMRDFRRKLKKVKTSESDVLETIAHAMEAVFKFRVVGDYRKVNDCIITERFPLPDLKEWYWKVKDKPFMSTTDLTSGFHQIGITPRASRYYAVTTRRGMFKPNCLTFGPKNGPTAQQRPMNKVTENLQNTTGLLDDTLIASGSFEEHIQDLKNFFQRLRKYRLTINHKSVFMRPHVKFLGVIAHHLNIQPSPGKILKLRTHPRPQTKSEIKSFVAFVRWMQDFIPKCAERLKPITEMLKKKESIDWKKPGRIEAFQDIITALSETTSLFHPDHTQVMYLYTDYSNYGIAGLLVQMVQGKLRPIRCVSRVLRAAEKNYSTTEGEMLAIVFAVESLKFYLLGNPFILLIDHKPLLRIRELMISNSRIQRWSIRLTPFVFEVKYVPSEKQLADIPSRIGLLLGQNGYRRDLLVQAQKRRQLERIYTSQEIKQYLKEKIVPRDLEGNRRRTFIKFAKKFRITQDDQLQVFKKGEWKLFVKEEDRPKVLREAHGEEHHTMGEMMILLNERYYWPFMYQDVKRYVQQNCVECMATSRRDAENSRLRRTRMQVTRAFLHWHLDYLTLGKTERDYEHVLLAVDIHSGFLQAFPVSRMSAAHVTQSLYYLLFTFGKFLSIQTDRASVFVEAGLTTLLEMLGIKHWKPTPYNPESNGYVESHVGFFKRTMRRILGNQIDWDLYVLRATFRCNATQKRWLNNLTSFDVILGYTPSYDDLMQQVEIVEKKNLEQLMNDKTVWLKETTENLQRIRHSKIAAEEYEALFDLEASQIFTPGNLVFIDPNPNRKKIALGEYRYHGPYVVTRVGRYNSIEIRYPNGERKWVSLKHVLRKVFQDQLRTVTLEPKDVDQMDLDGEKGMTLGEEELSVGENLHFRGESSNEANL